MIRTCQESVTKDPNDKDPFTAKNKDIAESGTERKHLKATIPEVCAIFLDLHLGDKLEWRMDILDGRKVAIARKIVLISDEETLIIAKKYAKKNPSSNADDSIKKEAENQ